MEGMRVLNITMTTQGIDRSVDGFGSHFFMDPREEDVEKHDKSSLKHGRVSKYRRHWLPMVVMTVKQ